MTRRGRGGRIGLAAGLVLVALAPHEPARAQTPSEASRLVLASQTPWVRPGQDMVARVHLTTDRAPADVELSVTVHRKVASRSEFAQSFDDRLRSSTISTAATPLTELTPDAAGALVIRLPTQDPGLPIDRARLRLRDEGVYPVRIELRELGAGPVLARLNTHLVYAAPPAEGGQPLGFSLIVPFGAPPALQADGKRVLDPGELQRLATVARALDAHADVPLTIEPAAETLVALSSAGTAPAAPDVLATLVRGAARSQVLGGPYVPLSPASFTELQDEAVTQRQRGNAAVAELLHVTPDTRTAIIEDRVDSAAILRLRDQQVDRFVLPEAAMTSARLDVTLAQPFDLETQQVRRPQAVALDAGIGAPLAGAGPDSVLSAHRILADLATIYFDRPGRPRAIVARPPRQWAPSAAFLDALLGGLADSPIVAGVTLDQVFASVPPATTSRGTPLRRSLDPATSLPAPASLPVAQLRSARSRIAAFSSMLDPGNDLDDRLEETLLVAEASGLRPGQRTALLDAIAARLRANLDLIRVPSARTITLTARRGDIPITIRSDADYPIRVQVRVSSDKLRFPNGSVRELELNRQNTTEVFAVESRTSGAFPLLVSLQSPDGSTVLTQSSFTVRSTAISGVGVGLSAGAGLVLVLWWGRHLVRGRRNRRLIPT